MSYGQHFNVMNSYLVVILNFFILLLFFYNKDIFIFFYKNYFNSYLRIDKLCKIVYVQMLFQWFLPNCVDVILLRNVHSYSVHYVLEPYNFEKKLHLIL